MSTPIKSKVSLDAQPTKEIEIYSSIPRVINKIGRLSPEIMQSFAVLENYVNSAIIQHYRIQQDNEAIDKYTFELHNNQLLVNSGENFSVRIQMEFFDLHFYAISIDKIEKLYSKIFELLSKQAIGARNTDEIRTKKTVATKQFEAATEQLSEARNRLEHLDKEIMEDNWGLSFEINETGSKFRLGKENKQTAANIDNIKQIKQAFEALIDYIVALPDPQ